MGFKKILLRYGNTNTFFINGLLVDTDMAGTISKMYKELTRHNIGMKDIRYILATHYHPDHSGLMSELAESGIKPLILDKQLPYIHYSDEIFARQPELRYKPIDETKAAIISCRESRRFLASIGISGEIIPTESHSADGVALVLDDGNIFVGDLEPEMFAEAYEDSNKLKADWERVNAFHPLTIHYSHRPSEQKANVN